jgi:hypothetical protein
MICVTCGCQYGSTYDLRYVWLSVWKHLWFVLVWLSVWKHLWFVLRVAVSMERLMICVTCGCQYGGTYDLCYVWLSVWKGLWFALRVAVSMERLMICVTCGCQYVSMERLMICVTCGCQYGKAYDLRYVWLSVWKGLWFALRVAVSAEALMICVTYGSVWKDFCAKKVQAVSRLTDGLSIPVNLTAFLVLWVFLDSVCFVGALDCSDLQWCSLTLRAISAIRVGFYIDNHTYRKWQSRRVKEWLYTALNLVTVYRFPFIILFHIFRRDWMH